MASLFSLSTHHSVNVIELNLPDSIDAMEFDRLNDALQSSVADHKGEGWLIDLSKVAYLGSAMLGLIVNIRHNIRSQGGKLVLCGLSHRLADIIRATSMERLFKVCGTRADAIKALRD